MRLVCCCCCCCAVDDDCCPEARLLPPFVVPVLGVLLLEPGKGGRRDVPIVRVMPAMGFLDDDIVNVQDLPFLERVESGVRERERAWLTFSRLINLSLHMQSLPCRLPY